MSDAAKPTASEREALIATAARVCDARGHGGLWPSPENCIVCGLAAEMSRLAAENERLRKIVALVEAEYRNFNPHGSPMMTHAPGSYPETLQRILKGAAESHQASAGEDDGQ